MRSSPRSGKVEIALESYMREPNPTGADQVREPNPTGADQEWQEHVSRLEESLGFARGELTIVRELGRMEARDEDHSPVLTGDTDESARPELGRQQPLKDGGIGESGHWPILAEEALAGLAGDIVRAIDPFTEGDPVAVLTNILTGFGNLVGDGPHFRVEFTRHCLRLFVAQVGETAKGRKGSSWSAPRHILREIDPGWADKRITSGLSSGEGLVYAVRDPRIERRPIREGGQVVDYQEVIVDHGVADKRLLVVEEELSQALKVMTREGNILSATLRQAWDCGNLHPLTKHNPIRATGAHISIIGHITRDELLRHLSETEQANGFANRFVWLVLKRSKVISNPTGCPQEVLNPLVSRLREAQAFAQTVTEMARDLEAETQWAEVYPTLSEGKPGLLGAILARAEAQVMRLGCIYALLDRSETVRPAHLRAALALWKYAEASARYIFGERLGNYTADRILAAIRENGGLSETMIRDDFSRNMAGWKIDKAIHFLYRRGLILPDRVETGGRPRTVWKPTT
jgi:hypothetical protein